MTLEINAQFNKFLRFAELQANPAKSEAIARVTRRRGRPRRARDRGGHGRPRPRRLPLGKAFGQRRNEERRNPRPLPQGRGLIFGGEKKIPESVRKAMIPGDYNKGKPLTARRIMAVQKALRPFIIRDAVSDAVDSLNRICRKVNRPGFDPIPQVDRQARQETLRLVKRFVGSGLNEWGIRALANAIVYAISAGYDPQAEARRVKAMIAPFRDFRPGDARFAAVDRKLLPYVRETLADYMQPKEDGHFDEDGLFDNFIKDTNRIAYTINGEKLPREARAVVEAFKEKIPDVRHRRALSCFFSQMSMSTFTSMSARKTLPDLPKYKDCIVMDQPGADMFAGLDNSRDQHAAEAHIVTDPRITLETSEDGKKATMQIEAEGMLLFAKDGEIQDFCRPIAGFTWKQEIVFDLGGEDAVITETHIGQDLIANIAPRSNEA